MAVPKIDEYYSVLEVLKEKIATTNELTIEEKERITPYGFGHMADGDIHITITI